MSWGAYCIYFFAMRRKFLADARLHVDVVICLPTLQFLLLTLDVSILYYICMSILCPHFPPGRTRWWHVTRSPFEMDYQWLSWFGCSTCQFASQGDMAAGFWVPSLHQNWSYTFTLPGQVVRYPRHPVAVLLISADFCSWFHGIYGDLSGWWAFSSPCILPDETQMCNGASGMVPGGRGYPSAFLHCLSWAFFRPLFIFASTSSTIPQLFTLRFDCNFHSVPEISELKGLGLWFFIKKEVGRQTRMTLGPRCSEIKISVEPPLPCRWSTWKGHGRDNCEMLKSWRVSKIRRWLRPSACFSLSGCMSQTIVTN